MVTRRELIAGGAAVAALALTMPVRAQSGGAIKIGTILTVTGFGAAYAALYKVAQEMALEDINNSGGINGSSVELLVEDDQAAPAQSVLLFRKLSNEGVVAELGPLTGTSWENVAPVSNVLETPAICWTALKSGVTRKPNAVRFHPPNDTMIPEGIAEFVTLHPEVKRIVVAGDMQEAGAAEAVQFYKKVAEDRGIEVLDEVGYQTRTTEFSPLAIRIRGHNPDALFISSLGSPALALLKELETQGFVKPIVGDATIWAGGAFIHAVGTAGKNLYTFGFSTNEEQPDNPKYNAFIRRYIERSASTTDLPQPVNVCNTSLCYDTVMLLAQILRDGGVTAETPVKDAREVVRSGIAKITTFEGINKIFMRDTGDGHIQTHLLKADFTGKMWKFALPPEQRLNQRLIIQ